MAGHWPHSLRPAIARREALRALPALQRACIDTGDLEADGEATDRLLMAPQGAEEPAVDSIPKTHTAEHGHGPSANDWESALVKTADPVQPCQNTACAQKWYVFDNPSRPTCPFSGTVHRGTIPVLNLYSAREEGNFRPNDHRVMVWTGQSLFPWHANRLVAPNERLTEEQRRRVGYFVLHGGTWWLVNEGLPEMLDADSKATLPVGAKVELKDGLKLLLSRAEGGRLMVVQMAGS